MAKPEWGKKRTCPKCGTRFYDLQQADPVVCIACENAWVPEPILKTKQPNLPEAVAEKPQESEASADSSEVEDEDLSLEDDSSDDDVLGDVSLDDDDSEDVSGVIDTGLDDDEDK